MPFRRFRRVSRERREWATAIQVTPATVVPNGLVSVNILSQATMEEFPGARVAFIQGNLFISPASAPAAASGYGVFFGITRIVGIGGSAANPDPEVNGDYNWVYWNSCFPQIGGTAAADSNASRWIGYFRFDIAMRTRLRWHDFDDLRLQVKNSNSSAQNIQFSYAFRFRILAGSK